MIPYFEFHTLHLGPLPIQVWGVFVAIGLLFGTWVAAKVGKERGLRTDYIWDGAFWVILGGVIGARLFYALFYAPLETFTHPGILFAIWNGGMSIMGGFIGAILAGVYFLRKRRADVWAYANTAVFGLPFGLMIGRIGCFLIHDHPGTASHFFLAVQNPDGEGGKHDLGLYDVFVCLAIALLFLVLRQRKVAAHWYVPLFLILYGAARFFLDFLRIGDTRYAGITPAQYTAIAFVISGGICAYKQGRNVKSVG